MGGADNILLQDGLVWLTLKNYSDLDVNYEAG